ncbi:MAG: HpcH/HpaI aldolase family protein [Betaproteobacteria bacterium]
MNSQIRMPFDDRLRGMFASGAPLHGMFIGLPAPALVEMCAFAGFDFVVIDNEHGSADLQTTEHMLRAARASGVVPIVRCLRHDIARVLDLGTSGVQVPMINNAAEAEDLVRRVRYPLPGGQGGQRGVAFSNRAAGYGAFGGAEHIRRSNDGIGVIAMIETPEGVANAYDIASVPGIDAVFVGPTDLAHSMGHEHRWQEPEVMQAIEHTLREVARAGKCPGTLAASKSEEERLAGFGTRYFAQVISGVIAQALKQAAAR